MVALKVRYAKRQLNNSHDPQSHNFDLDVVVVVEETQTWRWAHSLPKPTASNCSPKSAKHRTSCHPSPNLCHQTIESVYSTLRAFYFRLLLCGSSSLRVWIDSIEAPADCGTYGGDRRTCGVALGESCRNITSGFLLPYSISSSDIFLLARFLHQENRRHLTLPDSICHAKTMWHWGKWKWAWRCVHERDTWVPCERMWACSHNLFTAVYSRSNYFPWHFVGVYILA